MKNLILILSAIILGFSCSNENTKIDTQLSSRPIIPVNSNEVNIGTQTWMTKNLNVSRYRNGDPIPQVTDPFQWAITTTGAWCYWDNNPVYGRYYGKLYNWYAVNDPRGLAPIGWHIPSQDEWTILDDFLGISGGGKLKTTELNLPYSWSWPNSGATNAYGFSARPGGARYYPSSLFGGTGFVAFFWSSTSVDFDQNSYAYSRKLTYNDNLLLNYNESRKVDGYSVRCIKNN